MVISEACRGDFPLSHEEYDSLRSRIVTLKNGRGQHRKYLPYAFTEQGVAMLSGILRSERASLERKYDEQFKVAFDATRALMKAEEKPKRKIGFSAERE
jgi:ORF6N domain.